MLFHADCTIQLFEVIGGNTPAGGPTAATFYALTTAALVAPAE